MRLETSVTLSLGTAVVLMFGCGGDLVDQPPPAQLNSESPTIDTPFGEIDDDQTPAEGETPSSGSPHGAACLDHAECDGGWCLSGGDFVGGYCTSECITNADCERYDAECIIDADLSYCAQRCGDVSECRNGYECAEVESSSGQVCIPDRPQPPAVDGEACEEDSDCLGGFCITGADWADGYCTTLECENFEDCASNGEDNRCLLQSYRGGTNFCVRMCDDDLDCREGYICQEVGRGDGYCAPSPYQPVDVDHELYPFDITCGEKPSDDGYLEFDYVIDADTVAYMVTPYTRDGQWLEPDAIVLPSGDEIDFQRANYFQLAGSQIFGFLNPTVVPAIPDFELQLQAGTHTYGLETASEDLCYYVLQESTLGTTIDLNIYLIGVPGLDPQSAPDDPDMSAVLDTVDEIYSQAGIHLGNVRFLSLGEDAELLYSIVRSESDVFGLVANSSTPETDLLSVNIFFVEALAFSDGSGAIGISSGLPGPAGLHGTRASGVVFTSEFLGREIQEGSGEMVDGNTYTGVVFAHEVGHYLGLFHTSEQWGQGYDPLEDTPQCSRFPNCPDLTNLMFPFAGIDHTTVTDDQAWVVAVNPLTVDGGQE